MAGFHELTHPQKRIWHVEQSHPGTSMWNNAGTLKIRGAIDTEKLEQAIRLFIAANDTMRLRVTMRDGQPFQYVAAPDVASSFESGSGAADSDFDSASDEGQGTRASMASPSMAFGVVAVPVEQLDFREVGIKALYDWDTRQTQAPMLLLDSPLAYFAIARIADDEGYLYAKFHHVVSDGVTFVVAANKIMELYDALLRGEAPTLEQAKSGESYLAYAEEERRYLTSRRFARDEEFWLNRFADFPEPTVLKTRATGCATGAPGTKARRKACALPLGLSRAIRQFCEQRHLSVFVLLLAAFSVYANRMLGKTDVVVGAPVSNRTSSAMRDRLGMYVSTVPVRIAVDDEIRFEEFVRSVSREWFSVLKHQRYPYELLVAHLREKRTEVEQLYDVSLSYQVGSFAKSSEAFSYEGRWHFSGHQANSLNIHWNDREGDGKYVLDYDYLSPLFAAKEVDFVHEHLCNIIADAMTHPEKKLYELEVLSSDERNKVVYGFNALANGAGEAGREGKNDLVSPWSKRVAVEPDAVALVHRGVCTTVRELDERAEALASELRKRGVQPNEVVALSLPRSDAYVAAALGILKAGAAFMPVDRELPEERVAHMVADSHVRFAVRESGLSRISDSAVFGDACASRFPQPHDAAYVIYTSGSTGAPKGVVVEHRSIAHFTHVMREIWGAAGGSRMLCAGPVSFDISIMEAVIGLACGKTLVIAADDEADYPNELCRLISEQDIDMMMVTPGRMEMLLSSPLGAAALRRMRAIGMGADVLPLDLLKRVQALTNARIMNFYGPTEGTIAATCCDLTNRGDVNIGRPLPGVQAYILDAHRNPVPIGVRGELYLGGAGVARGYAGRGDLTAERFVPSPFREGERLYRTGDAARFFPRGEIQLQGRIDNQVKIRGYRVELGEIENRLMQVEGVGAAAVVADAAADGRKYLVGYVAGSDLPSEAAIKAELSKALPFYLIPARVVCLPELPLTANGKIDRARLPKPIEQRRIVSSPRTETERSLAAIWAQILGVSDVGRDDNFFDIGGDSLAIVHMTAQMAEEFDVDVSLEDVYRNPTVAACATLVDGARARSLRPVRPVPVRTYYPATSTQKRMMIASQQDAGGTAYNVPALYVFSGALDEARLRMALAELVRRHAVLRTQLCVRNDQIMQQVLKSIPLPFESLNCDDADLLRVTRAQVQPFDTSCAPLVRLVSVRSPKRHALLFDFHHAICDQAGLHVLMQDFSALYAGETLPSLAVDYPDCAVWLAERDASLVCEGDAAYWREELSGALPLLSLPVRGKRGGARRGAVVSTRVPEERLASLRSFVHEEHATLASALMMAFGLVLSRSAGQSDVVVGMPVACRGQVALQQVAGAFVNTVPVRCRFGRGRTVRTGFQAVNRAHVGALLHQDYPYERMVAECAMSRERGRNPLFDVMLVVGTGDEPLALDGVVARPRFANGNTAKLDLTLFAYDRGHGLECRLEYDKGLFSAAYARRLLARFVHTATTLFAAPYAPLDRASVLPPEEYRLVVDEFSSGGTAPVPEKCLPEWISDQAAERPDAEALVACDGRLTFAELDRRITCVARALAGAGARSDVGARALAGTGARSGADALAGAGARSGAIVAVVMHRTVNLIPVLLGIMRAGAAYLPIDPTYPAARVSYLLQDSAVRIVVCDEPSEPLVRQALGEGIAGCMLLRAGALVSAGSGGSANGESAPAVGGEGPSASCAGSSANGEGGKADAPQEGGFVAVSPDSSAYVIYTSGSTGLPKGSVLTRRGVSNLKSALGSVVGYDSTWTAVSVTTMSFDIFMADALLPLCFGCKVVLADEEELRQPHLLARLIEREGVTFLQTTPTRLGVMLESKPFMQAAQGLRDVVVAGEKPADALVRRAKRLLPAARLKNGYGPTEVTVYASFQDLSCAGHVSIGRPLANTIVRILDDELRPVPLGSVGEAYISGAGVSPGYLGRPELNAERFVASPFAPGEVMYKSGDACSFGEDGEIFIHGRVDNQVKLRGLRIEPEEIEMCMQSCAGVRQAAVAVRGEGSAKQLVAFYVGDASVRRLREHLAASLPSYMVPAHFARLEKLPLTANGKVDHTQLPLDDLGKPAGMRKDAPANGSARRGRGEAGGRRECGEAFGESERGGTGGRCGTNDMGGRCNAVNSAGGERGGRAVRKRKLSPDEKKFLRVFERVLDVRGITFDDNVFELGGDSLSVIAIQARLAAESKILKTQDFYDAPTLGSLYARLSVEKTSVPPAASCSAHAKEESAARMFHVKHSDLAEGTGLASGGTGLVSGGAGLADAAGFVAAGESAAERFERLNEVAASSWERPSVTPAAVLVTGATGFLGAHVVAELVRQGVPEVLCLVRAESDAAARKRMTDTLAFYFPDASFASLLSNDSSSVDAASAGFFAIGRAPGALSAGSISDAPSASASVASAHTRIRAVCGSIENDLSALAEAFPAIDAIVHCAAITDHVGSRQVYERVNVAGTRHAADLAVRLGATFVHVSTTSVAGLGAPRFDESSYFVGQEVGYNEYARSKFLAEGEVLESFGQGLSGFIARVGNLCGRAADGMFQRDPHRNAFAMRLMAFAALGCYPQDADDSSVAVPHAAPGAISFDGSPDAAPDVASDAAPDASFGGVASSAFATPSFEMTPVDVCAQALVALLLGSGKLPRSGGVRRSGETPHRVRHELPRPSETPCSDGTLRSHELPRIVHLQNDQRLSAQQLAELLSVASLREIKPVTRPEFAQAALDGASRAFGQMFGVVRDVVEGAPGGLASTPVLSSITSRLLASYGVQWPRTDQPYFSRYFNRITEALQEGR